MGALFCSLLVQDLTTAGVPACRRTPPVPRHVDQDVGNVALPRPALDRRARAWGGPPAGDLLLSNTAGRQITAEGEFARI